MCRINNITEGIGELDVFDNIGFVFVLELDNITGSIGELDVFDTIGNVRVVSPKWCPHVLLTL